ncbi:MAG: hypothetical protein ACT6RL_22135 [Neoaquamicrobium sediminum]|uniref:hypothetical protein n=1 Tax=Neoaquamicrobium sediminum TaxID=1849104 RepID=UPI0040376780
MVDGDPAVVLSWADSRLGGLTKYAPDCRAAVEHVGTKLLHAAKQHQADDAVWDRALTALSNFAADLVVHRTSTEDRDRRLTSLLFLRDVYVDRHVRRLGDLVTECVKLPGFLDMVVAGVAGATGADGGTGATGADGEVSSLRRVLARLCDRFSDFRNIGCQLVRLVMTHRVAYLHVHEKVAPVRDLHFTLQLMPPHRLALHHAHVRARDDVHIWFVYDVGMLSRTLSTLPPPTTTTTTPMTVEMVEALLSNLDALKPIPSGIHCRYRLQYPVTNLDKYTFSDRPGRVPCWRSVDARDKHAYDLYKLTVDLSSAINAYAATSDGAIMHPTPGFPKHLRGDAAMLREVRYRLYNNYIALEPALHLVLAFVERDAADYPRDAPSTCWGMEFQAKEDVVDVSRTALRKFLDRFLTFGVAKSRGQGANFVDHRQWCWDPPKTDSSVYLRALLPHINREWNRLHPPSMFQKTLTAIKDVAKSPKSTIQAFQHDRFYKRVVAEETGADGAPACAKERYPSCLRVDDLYPDDAKFMDGPDGPAGPNGGV